MSASRLFVIDEGLREHVKMMLQSSPELRPDNHDFLKSPYFDDIGVKTLNYLDSIFQWDNLEKSKFYKGNCQVRSTTLLRTYVYISLLWANLGDKKLTEIFTIGISRYL